MGARSTLLVFATVPSILVALPAQAQDEEVASEVRGRVLDAATGSPIWGAFVALSFSDEGVTTDSTGYFSLPATAPAGSSLVARQLGYVESRVPLPAGGSGGELDVRLRPDPVQLREIEVLGERFQRERNRFDGSVRAFDFQDLRRAPGETAFEVVMRSAAAAGIRPCGRGGPDEWCVLRRGELEPVRVYVDERPAPFGGVDWLRSFQTGELYLLEVYDRGRVIRILTRWAAEDRPEHLAGLRRLPIPWPSNGLRQGW